MPPQLVLCQAYDPGPCCIVTHNMRCLDALVLGMIKTAGRSLISVRAREGEVGVSCILLSWLSIEIYPNAYWMLRIFLAKEQHDS